MNARDQIRMVRGETEVRDGNTLVGYAAVFNSPTEINSRTEGHFFESFAPGAFKKTLAERGDKVKVLFNHGMDPSIGNKPLGKIQDLREDDHGLYYEVRLSDTSYNQDLRTLIADEVVDGSSFRFSVPDGKDSWKAPAKRGGLRERTVHEAALFEFGPVTFPAYDAASVGIRSATHFASWLDLDDEARAEIEAIFARSTDLSTLDTEAAAGTSDDESRETITEEPAPDHSEARRALHGRWLRMRAQTLGVFNG